jgi:hypothetical protein
MVFAIELGTVCGLDMWPVMSDGGLILTEDNG